jgi:hypothetical protein
MELEGERKIDLPKASDSSDEIGKLPMATLKPHESVKL